MKKLILLIGCLYTLNVFAQTPDYWQQQVNYTIAVSLNDKTNSLRGNASIEYINHSPDTLSFIYFHLWPNAYKNANTALAEQLLKDEESKQKLKNSSKGYIDSLRFTVNGNAITAEPDEKNIDVVKLNLASPLMPGKSIIIATPFFCTTPIIFFPFRLRRSAIHGLPVVSKAGSI